MLWPFASAHLHQTGNSLKSVCVGGYLLHILYKKHSWKDVFSLLECNI